MTQPIREIRTLDGAVLRIEPTPAASTRPYWIIREGPVGSWIIEAYARSLTEAEEKAAGAVVRDGADALCDLVKELEHDELVLPPTRVLEIAARLEEIAEIIGAAFHIDYAGGKRPA